MKFLFDENVHNGLMLFLSKLGHDIKLTPKSIKNGEVFKLALSEQRLLITRDKHFIEEPFSSKEHFGIWLVRIDAGNLELQETKISALLNQFSPEQLKGKVITLYEEESKIAEE